MLMAAAVRLESRKSNLLADVVLAHDRIVIGKRVNNKPTGALLSSLTLRLLIGRAMARSGCQHLAATDLAAERPRQSLQICKRAYYGSCY